MAFGPIQLIVVGFDNPEPDGSILAELNAVRDQGFIRLVDALAVYKDDEGSVWSAEVTDLAEDEMMLAGAAIGSLIAAGVAGAEAALHVDMDDEVEAEAAASAAADLVAGGALAGAERAAELYEYGLAEEDILSIADRIPVGGGALLMLVEHTWLIPLRDSILAQGGIVLAQEFLGPQALLAMGEDLAIAEELLSAASGN